MSGFEVAGVVLGSLPLVVVALEHYAEGVGKLFLSKEATADHNPALDGQKHAKVRRSI
jgi:hypothetical protein